MRPGRAWRRSLKSFPSSTGTAWCSSIAVTRAARIEYLSKVFGDILPFLISAGEDGASSAATTAKKKQKQAKNAARRKRISCRKDVLLPRPKEETKKSPNHSCSQKQRRKTYANGIAREDSKEHSTMRPVPDSQKRLQLNTKRSPSPRPARTRRKDTT